MKLSELRKAENLTQEQFAAKIGTKRVNVARYENGTRRPSPRTAEQIGQVLGLTVSEIWAMFYARDEGA